MKRYLLLLGLMTVTSCQRSMIEVELAKDEFATKASEVVSSGKADQFISKEKALQIIEPIANKYPERWIDISNDVIPSGCRIAYNSFGEKTELEDIKYYDSPKYDSWLLVVGPDVRINGPQRLLHIFMNALTGEYSEIWLEGRAIMEWDTSRNIYLEHEENCQPRNMTMATSSATGPTQWAVILSGGVNSSSNYARYWNDCQYAYRMLTQRLNYPSSHIFCLVSDGTNPGIDRRLSDNSYDSSPLDFDGDGIADIGYSATKSNVSTVFNQLRTLVSDGDEVLLFVTDHGTKSSGTAFINLWGGQTFSPLELNTELSKLGPNVNIDVVLGQCYSGAFIPTLKADKRTIITASGDDEVSRGSDTNGFDYFLKQWTEAFYSISPSVPGTHSNGDGYLSSLEAFQYALTEPMANLGLEHPQINNGPDAFSWGHDLKGHSFVPYISGPDYSSTNISSIYTLHNLPSTYSRTWTYSNNLRRITSNSNSITIAGNNPTSVFVSYGASVTASFSDIGLNIPIKKGIAAVWKPGSYIGLNLIKGGNGTYYVGAYNWDGTYGFNWECDNPSWVITGQNDSNPYHYVYISEGNTMDPVPLMVTFFDPFGEMIFVLDYFY